MRYLLVVVLLGLAIGAAFSSTYELGAVLGDFTQQTIDTANCKPTTESGANNIQVSINVDNPLPVIMRVRYDYYDFPSGTYIRHSKYCDVEPFLARPCKFEIPISLGGRGNGTITDFELLKLVGKDFDGKIKDEYTASFKFDIKHEQSLPEHNVLMKIKDAEDMMSQVNSDIPCEGEVCCGMGGAGNSVEQAKVKINEAEDQLRTCSIVTAYASASAAYGNASEALSSMESKTGPCKESLGDYNEARKAVRNAEDHIAAMGCQPDADTTSAMDKAKSKLNVAATKIATDDYETAQLELQGAEAEAQKVLDSAKCSSWTPPVVGSKPTGGDGSTGTASDAGGDGEAPLCPLGLIPVALAAFAYSKRSQWDS